MYTGIGTLGALTQFDTIAWMLETWGFLKFYFDLVASLYMFWAFGEVHKRYLDLLVWFGGDPRGLTEF